MLYLNLRTSEIQRQILGSQQSKFRLTANKTYQMINKYKKENNKYYFKRVGDNKCKTEILQLDKL